MSIRNTLRCLLACSSAILSVAAQQQLWRIDNPSQGHFGVHLAVIGDKDGDGHDDIVTSVSSTGVPQVWFYSGLTGQPLGQGRFNFKQIARAGDSDGDGVADYVLSGAGSWASFCSPWQCAGIEVRSGLTDGVLWTADMFPYSDMGHMLIGDLDLDGDGKPDVLVGTNGATPPGGGGPGILYAFSNGGQLLYTVVSAPGEMFAPGLGKFIDYNGDGCDDFLLGIYAPGPGAVDIRSGRDGTQLRRILGVPPVIWGHGATAAMIGDLDGDGIPDVLSGDSGPFTPGVIEILSSVTGNLIHRWQVNTIGGDNFGWPYVACLDVDRDGVDDVVANTVGGPIQNAGTYVYSGRDGSLIKRYATTAQIGIAGTVVALPPQNGILFGKYVSRGGTSTNTSIFMLSGAPPGVVQTGPGGQGTLAEAPRIGVRQFDPSGFRITLSGAEPFAPSLLVLGFSQPALPVINLQALGFQGCTLFPSPDIIAFTIAGSSGLAAGYCLQDFSQQLVGLPIPGLSLDVYVQWVTLGQTWPGGVTEAVKLIVR